MRAGTGVVELAKVLSNENRDEVLPRFFHRSKREAAEVAAALRPDEAPPRREMVTTLRPAVPFVPSQPAEAIASPSTEVAADTTRAVQPAEHLDANSAPGRRGSSSQPQQARALAQPLTADLRRLHVTVSRRFLEKLEAARLALSHARPGANAEDVLEAGLDLLLVRDARRKGQVEKPHAKIRPAYPEHLPAHVKREVWTPYRAYVSPLRRPFVRAAPAPPLPLFADTRSCVRARCSDPAARTQASPSWATRHARPAHRRSGGPVRSSRTRA